MLLGQEYQDGGSFEVRLLALSLSKAGEVSEERAELSKLLRADRLFFELFE
jgi:hypothetical protein